MQNSALSTLCSSLKPPEFLFNSLKSLQRLPQRTHIINYIMGETESIPFKVTQFPYNSFALEKNIGYCNLVRNIYNNQLLQQYDLCTKENIWILQQLQLYQYRQQQKQYIVQVLHIRKINSAGYCSGQNSYKIYCERIPWRLNDLNDISQLQGLVILRDALKGYNELKDQYAYLFDITAKMIGINEGGQVKVWINQNFHQNLPREKIQIKGYNKQSIFVQKLLQIIEEKMRNKSFPINLKSMLIDKPHASIANLLQTLENYTRMYNIQLPKSLTQMTLLKPSNKILKDVQPAEIFHMEIIPVPFIEQTCSYVYKQPSGLFSQAASSNKQSNTINNIVNPPHIRIGISGELNHLPSTKKYLNNESLNHKIINPLVQQNSLNPVTHFVAPNLQLKNLKLQGQKAEIFSKYGNYQRSDSVNTKSSNISSIHKVYSKHKVSGWQGGCIDADLLSEKLDHLAFSIKRQVDLVSRPYNNIVSH